jgi:predicted TIM-barrel fold metal-dependent hydrolase
MGLTKGIKLPGRYQGKTTKEAKLDPVYKYAEDYGMVLINHDWGSPEFLDELAEKYPKVCFIMGHPGSAEAFASVLNGRENVFECTTAASLMFGELEHLLKHVKCEKVLFGSDLGFLDGPIEMASVCYAKISDEAKRKILGLNMQDVLKKYCS